MLDSCPLRLYAIWVIRRNISAICGFELLYEYWHPNEYIVQTRSDVSINLSIPLQWCSPYQSMHAHRGVYFCSVRICAIDQLNVSPCWRLNFVSVCLDNDAQRPLEFVYILVWQLFFRAIRNNIIRNVLCQVLFWRLTSSRASHMRYVWSCVITDIGCEIVECVTTCVVGGFVLVNMFNW